MKFVSLAITVTSALGLAAIATARTVSASSPLGGPCTNKDQYGCGNKSNYNNNNDYAFYCTPENIVANVQDCDCLKCCAVDDGVATCL
ncbi:hypothetical protein K503DRAFT_770309 [Rhizopogon vinicolor AM-OR11-026]|uniref:Uncharacterized protein n=1 Tax=Rhizopogon vinicolor AM-OR11-026 TaxID=1314800 RepID=A0A1B7N184_9AGAM|nr:hypothetical protein K503DRAFT_770309 [Rhizopogon vinicolor AM-OR11-026]